MIYVYARISCVIATRHDHMSDINVHSKVNPNPEYYQQSALGTSQYQELSQFIQATQFNSILCIVWNILHHLSICVLFVLSL